MSDHQARQRQIKVSNDVWLNVFEWVGRAKLGLKVAPICARFDALVDEHFSATERQIKRRRLNTPGGSSRPRGVIFGICTSDIEAKVAVLKEAFLNATSASRHIAHLWITAGSAGRFQAQFQLDNSVGERLTLRQFERPFCWLRRCPIEWDEALYGAAE